MIFELFGKNWTLFTEKIEVPNPLLLSWRTPQNMLFIPLNFHCLITTVLGSITTIPVFSIIDDTGNVLHQILSPTALSASLTYHVSGLPGNVHNELLNFMIHLGFAINTPYIESIFQLELTTPDPGDTITEAVIYGLVANIE